MELFALLDGLELLDGCAERTQILLRAVAPIGKIRAVINLISSTNGREPPEGADYPAVEFNFILVSELATYIRR
jgi:hypothetical protein